MNLRRKQYPIDYYGGWNWVNLNQKAMDYVMDFLRENPYFLKKFKYTYCADEIWLQAILLNSSLKINNENLRLTEWEEHAKNPKTFTLSDLEKLKKSNQLFARKFDELIDKQIIEITYKISE